MPVLLTIGQNDRSGYFRRDAAPEAIMPLGNWPEIGRRAARDIPAKLVEIDNAGHVPHIEQPEPTEAALTTSLAARFQ